MKTVEETQEMYVKLICEMEVKIENEENDNEIIIKAKNRFRELCLQEKYLLQVLDCFKVVAVTEAIISSDGMYTTRELYDK